MTSTATFRFALGPLLPMSFFPEGLFSGAWGQGLLASHASTGEYESEILQLHLSELREGKAVPQVDALQESLIAKVLWSRAARLPIHSSITGM